MGGAMKFGFLGSGKMASALVQGAVQSGIIERDKISVSDAISSVAEKLAEDAGVRVVTDNAALCRESDVLVLCVKPGDALDALRNLGEGLTGKLVISIVAGL